jgi:peptidoglycan/LPS O-acetylase OafA/YrhL
MQNGRTILPERNLDYLRTFAVLLVFTAHLADCMSRMSPFTRWLGQAGVLAFFVHTSLVLMSSLERDGAPNQPHWILRFYVRRAFRIYPLAWVIIALVIAFEIPSVSLTRHYEPMTLGRVLANVALVQNLAGERDIFSPMWTLPLELQMYAMLPLCYLVVRTPSRVPMMALLVGGIAGAWFLVWGSIDPHLVPELWRLSVLAFIPCFLMGVYAFLALRRSGAGRRRPLPPWSWPFIVVAAIALLARFSDGGDNWITRIVFCVVLGAAIPLLQEARESRFSRLARTIATYSYSIYLIHLLAMRVGFVVLAGSPLLVKLAAVFVTLFVSCIAAYHFIEKPGILAGQRLLGAPLRPIPLEATAPAP